MRGYETRPQTWELAPDDALFVTGQQGKLPGVLDLNCTQRKEKASYSGQRAQLSLEQSYEGKEHNGG